VWSFRTFARAFANDFGELHTSLLSAAPRFALHGTSKTVLHCLADSCFCFLVRFPLHPISCFFCTRKAFVSNIGNLILREMFNTNQCKIFVLRDNFTS
jgi:hypothetical protein